VNRFDGSLKSCWKWQKVILINIIHTLRTIVLIENKPHVYQFVIWFFNKYYSISYVKFLPISYQLIPNLPKYWLIAILSSTYPVCEEIPSDLPKAIMIGNLRKGHERQINIDNNIQRNRIIQIKITILRALSNFHESYLLTFIRVKY